MDRKKIVKCEKRAVINAYSEDGLSVREIALKLNFPKSTVWDAVKRFRENGSNTDRTRSGRPRITTIAEDNSLVLMSKRDRRKTAPEIRAQFNSCHQNEISVDVVKKRLRSVGLNGRVAKRKPFLRKINKIKRMKWAQQHKNWTVDDFKKVLWTDESKFELFGNGRRTYVRRSAHEEMIPNCINPTVKHGGGSVTVWGAFSFNGVAQLCKVNGILEQKQYYNILVRHAIPAGKNLIGNGFTFQQDNDPKHTSNYCQNYLKNKQKQGTLKIMNWPPQSPDLNPIELLWDELDRQVRKKCPNSKETLFSFLESTWKELNATILHKLITRMPRIVAQVIKAKGGFFNEKNV